MNFTNEEISDLSAALAWADLNAGFPAPEGVCEKMRAVQVYLRDLETLALEVVAASNEVDFSNRVQRNANANYRFRSAVYSLNEHIQEHQ